ncbi:MAG: RDD family protein [Elusimicrobiota bacterium]
MDDSQKAGFWIRFAAHALDFWLFLLGTVVVFFLVGVVVGFFGAGADLTGILGTLGLLGVWAANACYYVLLTRSGSQTLGKRLMRLKVVSMDGSGVDGRHAFFRWLGYHVSYITLGIGYFVSAFSPEKRALHDHIAGTRVVRIGDAPIWLRSVATVMGLLLFVGIPASSFLAGKAQRAGVVAEEQSAEDIARARLDAIRQAVSAYQTDKGTAPKDLRQPDFVGDGAYLETLPELALPFGGHIPNRDVSLGGFADAVGDPSLWTDSGGWAYDPVAGMVFIDCTHMDSKGMQVYRW